MKKLLILTMIWLPLAGCSASVGVTPHTTSTTYTTPVASSTTYVAPATETTVTKTTY